MTEGRGFFQLVWFRITRPRSGHAIPLHPSVNREKQIPSDSVVIHVSNNILILDIRVEQMKNNAIRRDEFIFFRIYIIYMKIAFKIQTIADGMRELGSKNPYGNV